MLLLSLSLLNYLLLPAPSQYEQSQVLPQTTKEVVKAEMCKGLVLYYRNQKKGGNLIIFMSTQKAQFNMKMKYFFSSQGYLDLLLPNLKVLARFQNFKLTVTEKLMDGSVCPQRFELHHQDKPKVSVFGQPAANLLVSGHFQVTSLSVIRKRRQIQLFVKIYTYKAGSVLK